MPARKRFRPLVRSQLSTGTLLEDDVTSRHLSDLADAQGQGQARARDRFVGNVDLVVGANRVNHGLGRRARGANVTPTVADATFGWSFGTDGDRVAVLTVIGVAQPAARVEVW